MASQSERSRNNIRAGIFVTAVLVLTVAVVIVLTGAIERLTRQTTEYTARFDVASGVKNLSEGASVRVGGYPMGSVTAVRPLVDGDVLQYIEVDFSLDAAVEVYTNAKVMIEGQLVGGDAWLAFTSVGGSTDEQGNHIAGVQLLQDSSDPLMAYRSESAMLAGFIGDANAANFSGILSDFKVTTGKIRDEGILAAMVAEEDAGKVSETIENIRALSGDVRSDWSNWSTRVDEVMEWAGDFTASLDEAVAKGKTLLDDANVRANRTLDNANDGITEVRELVAENRDNVKVGVQSFKDIGVRVRDEILPELEQKVVRLLDSGNEAIDSGRATLQNLQTDYQGWSVNIGEALANANLASQQLKLTTVEVRRNPWKLLYKPGSNELQHELLYEATRSFALAAADLKAASQSVDRLMERHPDVIAQDPQAFEQIKQNLIEKMANYEEAQDKLLGVLFEGG